jgi:hypothetical protein
MEMKDIQDCISKTTIGFNLILTDKHIEWGWQKAGGDLYKNMLKFFD